MRHRINYTNYYTGFAVTDKTIHKSPGEIALHRRRVREGEAFWTPT